MSDNRIHLVPGVLVENVGDNVMVSLPDHSEVLSLTGDMAEIVVALRDGEEVSPSNGEALAELERRGVITLSYSKGVSRRQILTAGAAGVTGGVLALSMPAAAAASSFVCPVVTGEINQLLPRTVNDVEVWRLRMSDGTSSADAFSPRGTYWLEIFESPDGVTEGSSQGLHPVNIQFVDPDNPSTGIQGEVPKALYNNYSGAAIGVLYSDANRLCEVDRAGFDND